MRIGKYILAAAIVLLGAGEGARAQQRERFNPDYALRDIRAEIGVMGAVKNDGVASGVFQLSYSRLFWRRLAWKTGAVYVPNPGGYEHLAGVPVGIALRSFTVPVEDALGYAVGESVYDAVSDSVWGRTDMIGGHILSNFLLALFRRSEFFIGLTPGYYMGAPAVADNVETFNRFALTGDLGFSLAIPIWRFSINITPAYHYSFIKNFEIDGAPARHLLSVTAGIGFLF